MSYPAKAVANYFLDRAEADHSSLTPIRIQKLLFFAHGWSLAVYDKPLVADPIEAWHFGPVIASIYHEFKPVRGGSIFSKATEFNCSNFELVKPSVPTTDRAERALMDTVWTAYGRLTGFELSCLTHAPGTPWAHARSKLQVDASRGLIDDASIRDHFKILAKNNRALQADHASA